MVGGDKIDNYIHIFYALLAYLTFSQFFFFFKNISRKVCLSAFSNVYKSPKKSAYSRPILFTAVLFKS